jgi:hypothetical protein
MQYFDIVLLIARPAAGKSEIIKFLRGVAVNERMKVYHIGEFEEIDDFPMLWTWFEEDIILEKMGYPRLHTTPDGYFKYSYLWDVLIHRINLEYQKLTRDFSGDTVIIEFSRGSEHGGYENALQHLSHAVLSRLAILYIDVPWEESLRKNRRRFNPKRPDSILEHGLPDEKLERLYRHTDWHELTDGPSGFIKVGETQVPYANFDNQDDVTTDQGPALAHRLQKVLSSLWQLYTNND